MEYFRWTPDCDPLLENEDDQISDIIASGTCIQARNFHERRHAHRLTHQKTQALLKGKLTVDANLAPELAQGFFSKPGTYDAAVRFANEPSALLDDTNRQPRGLALRVFGAKGIPLDEQEERMLNQDFLFNNAPMIELRDVPTYVKVEAARAKHGVGTLALDAALATSTDAMTQLAPKMLPNTHLAAQKYYSQCAFRWGDYVGKYSLQPIGEAQKKIETAGTSAKSAEAHSEMLEDYFRNNDAEFEFLVQLKPTGDGFSIEDGATPWDEKTSPYRRVGTLHLSKQEAFSHARRVFWEDRMSLDVWKNTLEAHRPLGSLQRSRRRAYEASRKFREEHNATPIQNITAVDQIPD